MHAKDNIKFEDVLERAKTYIESEEQLKFIEQAYLFAKEKHAGQFRKSGEDYIVHPLNVAMILTTIYADYQTIAAGFLHDVLEDCDCTQEEMEEKFGNDVTKLVQGVTKLSKIHFSTENEYLIDYYKKIIVGMSEDVRVIIIKLADRLHNMRTLWATPPDRQKVKAKEALEILAPIAHHLGIHKIKSELEDLALRYLKPDVFYDIAEKLNKTKLERDRTVVDMEKEIQGYYSISEGMFKYLEGKYQILDKKDDLIVVRDYNNPNNVRDYIMNSITGEVLYIAKNISAYQCGYAIQKYNNKVVYCDNQLNEITREFDLICLVENGEVLICGDNSNNGEYVVYTEGLSIEDILAEKIPYYNREYSLYDIDGNRLTDYTYQVMKDEFLNEQYSGKNYILDIYY